MRLGSWSRADCSSEQREYRRRQPAWSPPTTSPLQALDRLDKLGLPFGTLVDLLLDQRPAAQKRPVARRRLLVEDALLQLSALALSLLRPRDVSAAPWNSRRVYA